MYCFCTLYQCIVFIKHLLFPEPESELAPECMKPAKVIGRCRAAIPRWSYMADTDTCEQFTWGGCHSEEVTNNFQSMINCEMECKPSKCPPYMCAMYCEHGFKKDENGCDKCECEECSQLMCMMHCEHGFEQDEHGCDICKCKGNFNELL